MRTKVKVIQSVGLSITLLSIDLILGAAAAAMMGYYEASSTMFAWGFAILILISAFARFK